MNANTVSPVTRLAPSPTGWLHLGHARSFLVAWWYSRKLLGSVKLRMDDLDAPRVQQKFVDGVLEDLHWLGLDWDGPTLFESKSVPAYMQRANQLQKKGDAYPCTCSRGEIQAAISAPHASDPKVRVYPGTCRTRFPSVEAAEQVTGKLAGLRFRPATGHVHFVDLFAGPASQDVAKECGDFLIVRRDKVPCYHLAVVVSDDHQGITHVIRGDDLLDSTPRQLRLCESLGLRPPRHLHIPLVVNEAGKRLAKRSDSLSLRDLRESGVSSAALVRWIAHSVGIDVSSNSTFTASEYVTRFELARLASSPLTVDEHQLPLQLRSVS